MSGVGSGRRWSGGGRKTVETRPSIDANLMNREKRSVPALGECGAHPAKSMTSAIPLRKKGCGWRFEVSAGGGGWKSIRQTVAVVRAPCRFGGERAYFVCSGLDGSPCGQRAVKLYADTVGFFCRRCLGLAYASQNEDAWDRARRRAQKARLRIGGGPDVNAPLPFIKPRNMQSQKFSRLYRSAEEAKDRAVEAFIANAQEKFRSAQKEEVKELKGAGHIFVGGQITIKGPACRSLSEIRREKSDARFVDQFVGHARAKKLTYWNI